jgi:hypothetical protein
VAVLLPLLPLRWQRPWLHRLLVCSSRFGGPAVQRQQQLMRLQVELLRARRQPLPHVLHAAEQAIVQPAQLRCSGPALCC